MSSSYALSYNNNINDEAAFISTIRNGVKSRWREREIVKITTSYHSVNMCEPIIREGET